MTVELFSALTWLPFDKAWNMISLALQPADSLSRLATLYTESSPRASWLPPPPFLLLPVGASQFPGRSCTR